jgi:hypothetical protein
MLVHTCAMKTARAGLPGLHVEPPAGGHRFQSVRDQVEEYALHTRANQRQLDSSGTSSRT